MVSVLYPGLPGVPTRLPASLPAVAIDLGNMSQYNDYEAVDDRKRANSRYPCIKCNPSAGDEPVEIGRSISDGTCRRSCHVLVSSFLLSFSCTMSFICGLFFIGSCAC
jgi:hypothetical protein